MILLKEFKKCLPECLAIYLNEQKANSLSSAAVLADEYMLTHKTVLSSTTEKPESPPAKQNNASMLQKAKEEGCFYCHKTGRHCELLNFEAQRATAVSAKCPDT